MAAIGMGTSASGGSRGKPYNILMIITDQEQSMASFPEGLLEKLPGHRRLLELGTNIANYHVHTTPCSPSRSTIFSGHHTQRTGLFLNSDTPPNPIAAHTMPTLGHMMQEAGYFTSYKGKWHLSQINRKRDWNRVPGGIYPNTSDYLVDYGFHDYGFDGEEVGLTWDGYRSDMFVAADVSRQIFDYAEKDRAGGKPWFQVAGLVNPHDIMFYDATGNQAASRPHPDVLAPVKTAPGDPLYEVDNGFPLPESFHADDLSDKPEAHRAIARLNDAFFGEMPLSDEASWRRFVNYYYNCLRDVDRRVEQMLWALEASGQMENTIIIYTTDHGERAAAHGMRQKGGTMYREETNVPMIVVHPDIPGGRTTSGLMGAIDLAPTLMTLGGMSASQAANAFPDLPGVDVSSLLMHPQQKTQRDDLGHLFNYAVAYYWEPKSGRRTNTTEGAANYDQIYDLTRRRLHRGVHDGRYKFARYFAPAHHHVPADWETLDRRNDLELYDTRADPNEITNLAYDPARRDDVLRLNAMVNRLIEREVGRDDGSEYPGPTDIYNQEG
ncbi:MULTISPECIES: sulfatase-like hydrolase/transferase [Pacificimonas]|nr:MULTISPECIES: sulfatase-like hydrolase/transferase [Pacificimonas]MBZ6379590.1 sulfatase-like hydrolase/transferase [Pacificimonas aurantium]